MAYQLVLPGAPNALAQGHDARPAAHLARQGGHILCRGLQALRARLLGQGYRPELHYMRGGRTPGCRSLARLGRPAG